MCVLHFLNFIYLCIYVWVLCPPPLGFLPSHIRVTQYLPCGCLCTIGLIFGLAHSIFGLLPLDSRSIHTFILPVLLGWSFTTVSIRQYFCFFLGCVYTHTYTNTFPYTHVLINWYVLLTPGGKERNWVSPFQQLCSSSFWPLPTGMWIFLFWVKAGLND